MLVWAGLSSSEVNLADISSSSSPSSSAFPWCSEGVFCSDCCLLCSFFAVADSTPLQRSNHFIGFTGAREETKLKSISFKSNLSLLSVSMSSFDRTICSSPFSSLFPPSFPVKWKWWRTTSHTLCGSCCVNCLKQLAADRLSNRCWLSRLEQRTGTSSSRETRDGANNWSCCKQLMAALLTTGSGCAYK